MKRTEVLSFDGGTLEVKIEGHELNGAGRLTFEDSALEWDQRDCISGARRSIDVPRSELLALRDFLHRLFPAE